MKIIRSKNDLQKDIESLRHQGKKIGFVPTMGALHEGHLSLIDTAREHAEIIVVSIYVNPAQFAAHEDLETYPRDEADDLQKLESRNVDIAYLPTTEEIYPNGDKPDVQVPTELADILCGKSRPHFFHGVATVVKRLFEQVKPDIAVFGEKDYQQLQVIKWLVQEYNLPIEIIGSPLMREPDGLAMSSRNKYLSAEERKIAPELYKTLQSLASTSRSNDAIATSVQHLEKLGIKVDYIEMHEGRLFAAAQLGKTRLIDNI